MKSRSPATSGNSAMGPDQNAKTNALFARLRTGEPRALAKVITLLESSRADHRQQASLLVDALRPYAGNALRLGISGSPGVGKSTFIETMGLEVLRRQHKLAVLAVDPSSQISGGSIMGDKTRMELLSRERNAFIRPSPAGETLGGVNRRTRESMLACEAAGYDLILVETVGVGQSETTVADMVDLFILLQLPNAGDDLQAIKRGIVELADLIVINKADLDPGAAERAARQFASALHLLKPVQSHWTPKVLQCSALTGAGIPAFCDQLSAYRDSAERSGQLQTRRRQQNLKWMWALVDDELHSRFRNHPKVNEKLEQCSQAVADGTMAATEAAAQLLALTL